MVLLWLMLLLGVRLIAARRWRPSQVHATELLIQLLTCNSSPTITNHLSNRTHRQRLPTPLIRTTFQLLFSVLSNPSRASISSRT